MKVVVQGQLYCNAHAFACLIWTGGVVDSNVWEDLASVEMKRILASASDSDVSASETCLSLWRDGQEEIQESLQQDCAGVGGGEQICIRQWVRGESTTSINCKAGGSTSSPSVG